MGRRAKDRLGRFICVGVFSMIAAQTVMNVGMCLSVLPVIGVTLPLFSGGGTSVVATYLGIGLAMSVSDVYKRQAFCCAFLTFSQKLFTKNFRGRLLQTRTFALQYSGTKIPEKPGVCLIQNQRTMADGEENFKACRNSLHCCLRRC